MNGKGEKDQVVDQGQLAGLGRLTKYRSPSVETVNDDADI